MTSPGSDPLLRILIDSLPDLIWLKDPEGRYLTCNHRFERFFGVPENDLMGKTDYDFVAKGQADFFRANDHAAIRAGVPTINEEEITFADGHCEMLETIKTPLKDKDGRLIGVLGVGRDITERVRERRALVDSEQWFRGLFHYSADAIFLHDLSGRILMANRTACERLGYSEVELAAMSVADLQAPDSRDASDEQLNTIRETGTLLVETVHRSRAGRLIPTEVNSRTITIEGTRRVLKVARDITERHRSERTLRESRARYELLFENSGTHNAIYDIAGRVVMANKLYGQLFGLSEVEVVGRSVEELYGADQAQEFRMRFRQTVAEARAAVFSTGLELPSSPKRWFQVTFNPLFDDAGEAAGLQVVAQEFTETRQLLDKQNQNEKLQSIGILAAGIAHDVNNLLAGLLGQIELAKLKLTQGQVEEARARLEKTTDVFSRAKSLTNQLLTFSKGGTPVRELQALGPRLREWAAFAISGSDLALEFEVARDLWLCECDSQQLGQVVDNLLINARQASPPSGTICVGADNLAGAKPRLRIWVADQGPGVPADLTGRIFDPFFTTKGNGTGMGLATSRSIIEQHGGTLELEPSDKGAVFVITLPASPGRRQLDAQTPKTEFRGTGWALVMDDEESLRDTVGSTLRSVGFQVITARDGHDALLFWDDLSRKGDALTLAVLDLTIPGGMGGLDTARHLRQRGCTAPLLAVSGYSEESGKLRLGDGLFAGQLTKPFSISDLTQLLSRLLA